MKLYWGDLPPKMEGGTMGIDVMDYGNAELLTKQTTDFENRLADLVDDALAEGILFPAIVIAVGKAQAALTMAAIPNIMDAITKSRKKE